MSESAIEINSRLLIVDDNRAIHEDFKKVLGPKLSASPSLADVEEELFGNRRSEPPASARVFQMDSAFQGQEALALVKQSLAEDRPYAMAFMDVRMPPGWDGIEATAKIWEVDPDLQIVICTAYSDYSWDEMLRKLGQSDRLVILKKPFDNIEVTQLAHSLTRKWQLHHEAKKRLAGLEETVVARTEQMVREQEKFRGIFENSPEGIFQKAPDGGFICANPALVEIYGYASAAELMAQFNGAENEFYVDPARRAEWQRRMKQEKVVREFESEIRCRDGSRKWISETTCQVSHLDGSLLFYQGFVVDITARRLAQSERNLMEVHLRQAQKLESVGQLAAGIAHEINTPIQYVGDNIRFVESSFESLNHLLRDYQSLVAAVRANTLTPEVLDKVESASREVDLDYLSREIPLAVHQSLDGINQVTNIVRAMKEFSHPGAVEMVPANLNHAIQTTATVARNEWKYVAELVTDLAPDLPLVPCVPGEFNQVILNLIVNAAHAINDVVKDTEGAKGVIKITTRVEGDSARIDISDTGAGIPMEVRHRIFEPFFTTKEVGKGTGQGLAIARATIVTKHGGQLTFESTVGQGTTFTILLPLEMAKTGSGDKKMANPQNHAAAKKRN